MFIAPVTFEEADPLDVFHRKVGHESPEAVKLLRQKSNSGNDISY